MVKSWRKETCGGVAGWSFVVVVVLGGGVLVLFVCLFVVVVFVVALLSLLLRCTPLEIHKQRCVLPSL